jgi:hypothetical protein
MEGKVRVRRANGQTIEDAVEITIEPYFFSDKARPPIVAFEVTADKTSLQRGQLLLSGSTGKLGLLDRTTSVPATIVEKRIASGEFNSDTEEEDDDGDKFDESDESDGSSEHESAGSGAAGPGRPGAKRV